MKGDGVSVTLTLLLVGQTALLAGVYSQNDITAQSGRVEAKQGHNVSLWCKLKYDSENVLPVSWQSPPKFRTRSIDCESIEKEKYVMSCSGTGGLFEFYNLTIMDLQWADTGAYRCMHTRIVGTVDLQVLVPVTEVTLTTALISSAADPLSMHKDITCTTNCAYPAPTISWFENKQPFNGTATDVEYDCSAERKGQRTTSSKISVKETYDNKEGKDRVISCTAENVIGEPNISKAIAINYDVTPSPPQPITSDQYHIQYVIMVTVIPSSVIALIAAVAIIVCVLRRRNHKKKGSPQTLLEAVKERHHTTDSVTELLGKGEDVNQQDEDGWTALMFGSYKGPLYAVKRLLEMKAEVDRKEKTGLTALMIASYNDQCGIIDVLLEYGADVNAKKKDGWTALMLATVRGHFDVVRHLLEKGAEVDKTEKFGWTALMIASYNGQRDVVDTLLEDRADVNKEEKDGWTALMMASFQRRSDIAKKLLNRGAEVDKQNKEGWTALMIAIQMDSSSTVDVLLNAKMDIDKSNKNNTTALMIASKRGHSGVIEKLVEHGYFSNEEDKLLVSGQVPLGPPIWIKEMHLAFKKPDMSTLESKFKVNVQITQL